MHNFDVSRMIKVLLVLAICSPSLGAQQSRSWIAHSDGCA